MMSTLCENVHMRVELHTLNAGHVVYICTMGAYLSWYLLSFGGVAVRSLQDFLL